MGSIHSEFTGDEIHAVTVVTYADIAARNADTTFNLNADNIDKLVRVNSPLSLYFLVSVTGVPANDWMILANFNIDTFIGLLDTPGDYTSQAGKVVQVNSVPDGLEFADFPDTIYTASAVVTGDRTVAGNANFLLFNSFNTVNGNDDFTALAELNLNVGTAGLLFIEGDGGGTPISQKSIELSLGSMLLTDTTSSIGLQYADNYATNGILVTNERWIPDLAHVTATFVKGPSVSPNDSLARFDGVNNKTIQATSVLLNDSAEMSGLTQLTVDQLKMDGQTLTTIADNDNIILSPSGTGTVDVANSRVTLMSDPSGVLDGVNLQTLNTAVAGVPNIYNADGSIDNEVRTFNGDNVSKLLIRMQKEDKDTFTLRSEMVLSDTQAFLSFQTGLGGGSVDKQSDINITASAMTVQDRINDKGFVYMADYSVNGSLDDRWIPDKFYSDRSPNSSKIQVVHNLSDFPTPAASVINLDADTNYYLVESVDLGTLRIIMTSGSSLTGIRSFPTTGATILSGTTTLPLITATLTTLFLDIRIDQNGTGDLFDFDPLSSFQFVIFRRCEFRGGVVRVQKDTLAVNFFNCGLDTGATIILDANYTGGFIGILDSTLLSDNADGDVLLLVEDGAVSDRIQVSTGAFLQQEDSTGIKVEDGATVNFLEFLGAGFNLFSPGAVAIQCDDPDAITQGRIRDTQFTPGAINLRADPTIDSTVNITDPASIFAVDCTILNGDMFLSDFTSGAGYHAYTGISSTEELIIHWSF